MDDELKVRKIQSRIKRLHNDLMMKARRRKDARYAALYETAGEVVMGIEEVFDQYSKKFEKAMYR